MKTSNSSFFIAQGPVWIKIATKAYSDFSTGALTNTIASGYSLPARAVVTGCQIIANTLFSGGSIASYTISVGIGSGGSKAKYGAAQNVFTGATLTAPNALVGIESTSVATSITLTATSTTANLSAATAGTADIYLLVSQLT